MRFNTLYKLILESIENQKNIQKVSNSQIEQLISSGAIKNNNDRISGLGNLTKLLYDDKIQWYIYKVNDKVVACAACRPSNLQNINGLYINQLFGFEKGYGSKLLSYILALPNYDIIFLNSDWTQAESLNDYYRRYEFGLTEYICDRDTYKVHYFYKNHNLSQQDLNNFIGQIFK